MTANRPVIFDTSVYVSAVREGPESPPANLLRENIPRTHMVAVVLGELRAGQNDARAKKALDRLERQFRRVGRLISPPASVWSRTGEVLARMRRNHPEMRSKIALLWNDALIAMCARQIGARLVTCNAADFLTIRRFVSFDLQVLSARSETDGT